MRTLFVHLKQNIIHVSINVTPTDHLSVHDAQKLTE